MVGRAMMDKLQSEGYYNLIVPSERIDLRNQRWVNEWYEAGRISQASLILFLLDTHQEVNDISGCDCNR